MSTTKGKGKLNIQQDVPLADKTTFQLGGKAEYYFRAEQDSEIVEAIKWAQNKSMPIAVFSGGSNVIVPDQGVTGLVLEVATQGISLHEETLTLRAGHNWDDAVAFAVQRGLCGIECLSGIPGSAGATPIQNVGAYGQEISDTFVRLEAFDIRKQTTVTFEKKACLFEYRDSLFKQHPGRFIVLRLTLALSRSMSPVRYAELVNALQTQSPASPVTVRQSVLKLRRNKSMLVDSSDENYRNAGSFFTNPVIEQGEFFRLVGRLQTKGIIEKPEDIPHYKLEGSIKLAAAWLVEQAGFSKGLRIGNFGISTKHALCLVHHGDGSCAELLALEEQITKAVHSRFGVSLKREPTLLQG